MGFLPINVGGVKPADDFNYPAGEYILQCVEAKAEPTKDGTGYRFIIKSKIVMGPGPSRDMQNKPITHSYALTEKSRPFLVRAAIACGVTQEQINAAGGQIDTDWFVNKQYVVRISMRDQYTNVDRERPLAAWTHGGIASQPAATPQAGVAQPGLLQAMPGAVPQQQMAPPQQQYQQPPMQQPMAQPQMAPQGQPQYQQPMQQPPMQQPQMAPQGAPMQQPGLPVPQGPPQGGNAQPAVGMPAPPPPGGQVPQQ